jgi:hypothetical protein
MTKLCISYKIGGNTVCCTKKATRPSKSPEEPKGGAFRNPPGPLQGGGGTLIFGTDSITARPVGTSQGLQGGALALNLLPLS